MDRRLRKKIVFDVVEDVFCVLLKNGIYHPAHYKNSDIDEKYLKVHKVLFKTLTEDIIKLIESQNELITKHTTE
jgi:hypothetical protein